MACCSLCKYVLVAINLLFSLLSFSIFVVGIIVLVDANLIIDTFKHFDVDLEDILSVSGFDVLATIKSGGVYMVVLGAVMGIVSVLGCCGAFYENKCMLGLYIAFLGAVMIVEIAAIVLIVVLPDKFQNKVEESMSDFISENFRGDVAFDENGTISIWGTWESQAVASLQIGLECCGAANYTEYALFRWNNTYELEEGNTTAVIPASCCVLKKPRKFPKRLEDFEDITSCLLAHDKNAFHERGCYQGMVDYVNEYAHIAIGVVVAVFVLEFILIILAVCTCRGTK